MKKKKKSVPKGVYRDGDKLVVREGTRLPDRCVICNKKCDGETLDFEFSRQKMVYLELAAIQALADTASDLVKGARYTGPVQVWIPLCSWHRKRRLLRIAVGGGVFLLAGGFLLIRYALAGAGQFDVLQISLINWIAILIAFVGFTVATGALADRTLVWFRVKKYYDRFVWLAGAGQAYLRTLPDLDNDEVKAGHNDPREDAAGELTAEELIRRSKPDD